MTKAQFTGLLTAQASENNPLHTIASFVFTDFLPNRNRQGVKVAEAGNILKSGLNAPVKVDFTGHRIGDHDYAIPVGHIFSMAQEDDKIVGKAIIWKNEFPDLVTFLEKAQASEGGVHFSWELFYTEGEQDDSGVEWLKDVIVGGIAIVSNPAYSGRTPLLSLASEKKQVNLEQLHEKVAAVIDGLEKAGVIEEKRDTMELEALVTAVEGLKGTVESLQTKFDAFKIETPEPQVLETQASEELETLKGEVEELRKFKADSEAAQARAELLSNRTQALSSLMSADEVTAKADFILALSDEQFEAFVASIQAIASKQPAKSSASIKTVPDPLAQSVGTGTYTVKDVAQAYLKASRASE